MAIYRAALVWLLRIGALATVAFATLQLIEMQDRVAIAPDPGEAASYGASPSEYFVPAAAVALVCLTLSEILSLLAKRA